MPQYPGFLSEYSRWHLQVYETRIRHCVHVNAIKFKGLDGSPHWSGVRKPEQRSPQIYYLRPRPLDAQSSVQNNRNICSLYQITLSKCFPWPSPGKSTSVRKISDVDRGEKTCFRHGLCWWWVKLNTWRMFSYILSQPDTSEYSPYFNVNKQLKEVQRKSSLILTWVFNLMTHSPIYWNNQSKFK